MPNEVVIHVKADSKQAEESIEVLGRKIKVGLGEQVRVAAQAMTAFGLGITAALGFAVKATLEEEQGIRRLDTALQRAGVSYLQQKQAIEGVVAAQQRLTNFSDTESRAVLERLVTLTSDYATSLAALPVTLDIATSLQIDHASAATLVGKALTGSTETLSRYGIKLAEGATRTEILAAWTAKFGGSAKAAAHPINQLQNTFGKLMETVGAALLPVLTKAAAAMKVVIERVTQWMEANPGLSKVLIIATGVIAGLAAVIGPLLLLLPSLIAGFYALGAAAHFAMGPIGLITLGLGALAVGVVTFKLKDMADATRDVGRALGIAGTVAAGAGVNFDELQDRIGTAIPQLDRLGDAVIKALRSRNEAARDEDLGFIQGSLDAMKTLAAAKMANAQDDADRLREDVQERHRIETQSLGDLERTERKSLDDRQRLFRNYTEGVIAGYERQGDAAIKAIRAQTTEEEQAIQAQIDALEGGGTEADRANRKAEESDRRRELVRRVDRARTGDELRQAEEELAAFDRNMAAQSLDDQRQDAIAALRIQLAAVRDKGKAREDASRETTRNEKELAQAIQTIRTESLRIEGENLDKSQQARSRAHATRLGEETTTSAAAGALLMANMERETSVVTSGLEGQLEARRTHWETVNTESVIAGAALKMVASGNQAEIIALLEAWNPNWQNAGQSFGDSLIRGLNSTKTGMAEAISGLMAMLGSLIEEAKKAAEAVANALKPPSALPGAPGGLPLPMPPGIDFGSITGPGMGDTRAPGRGGGAGPSPESLERARRRAEAAQEWESANPLSPYANEYEKSQRWNQKQKALDAMGFQHGGSFVVPGSGGPDSQQVAFRASPGERVTVSPEDGGGNSPGAFAAALRMALEGMTKTGMGEAIASMMGMLKPLIEEAKKAADAVQNALKQKMPALPTPPTPPGVGFGGIEGPGAGDRPSPWPEGGAPRGFQHGGSFVVPGSGGPDSQNVAFRASPGERVTVGENSPASLAQALRMALEGMAVVIDGSKVGRLTSAHNIGTGTIVGRMGGGLG